MWNPSLVYGPISNGDGEYLLNLAPQLATPELDPFRIHPDTPDVIWAGDSPAYATVFVRFANEAAARAALPDLWVDVVVAE